MAVLSRSSVEARLVGAASTDAKSYIPQLEKELCRRDLYEFLRRAWEQIDPAPFVDGWHLRAACLHLEALARGEIGSRRLVCNFPPRHSKSNLISVIFQVWVWIQDVDPDNPLVGPQVPFLCGSYSAEAAEASSLKARRLIRSPWFERLWGDYVRISRDKDNLGQFDTTAGGSRISCAMAESLGKGGLYRILDDPHKSSEIESSAMREQVLRDYDEVWSTRSNDPRVSVEVIVMQRLAENDLIGHIAAKNVPFEWLCLPGLYDPERHCSTSIGFEDPRGCDDAGNLLRLEDRRARADTPLWPEVWSKEELLAYQDRLGSFAFASQIQQMPVPRGGHIIDPRWWRLWDRPDFPDFGTMVAALDGAFTVKNYSDNSAMTVWGAYPDERTGRPRVMLREAWKARLTLQQLVARSADTCDRFKVDVLVIGAMGGHHVAEELRRLYGDRRWRVELFLERVDKVTRLRRIEHLFEGGIIYAPDKDWAQMVIDEVGSFPRSKEDNLVDTCSAGLNWMRNHGVALTKAEFDEEEVAVRRYRRPVESLYGV